MREHRYAIGEIVKARPFLQVPRSPTSSRPFAWPFFYPGRIVDLIGDDGALVEFLDHDGREPYGKVITPWLKTAGYSVRELHGVDCTCRECEAHDMLRDPRAEIERLHRELDGIGDRRAAH